MNFLKKLFLREPNQDDRFLTLYALSHRCPEPLTARIDLMNELSQTDTEDAVYYCRKVLHTSGKDRCFATVEISLWFDSGKRVRREEVSGGRLLDEAQYAEALARYQAAAEEEESATTPGEASGDGSSSRSNLPSGE